MRRTGHAGLGANRRHGRRAPGIGLDYLALFSVLSAYEAILMSAFGNGYNLLGLILC